MHIEDHDSNAYTVNKSTVFKLVPKMVISLKDICKYLNVSRIMVKRTNFPSKGTTSDVGGMISASKRKNTVNDSNMLMERETCNIKCLNFPAKLHFPDFLRTFSPLSEGK